MGYRQHPLRFVLSLIGNSSEYRVFIEDARKQRLEAWQLQS